MRPRVVEVTPGGNFGNIKQVLPWLNLTLVYYTLCVVYYTYALSYNTFHEDHVQAREGYQDAATGAPDLEVELVLSTHVDPSKARTTTGEAQIFSCYCGDHFITLGSYAKHAASHASGEWKPEPDEDFDEREEIYLNVKCSGIDAPVDLKRRRVKQDSVSSSTSFFTAQTHQGSL